MERMRASTSTLYRCAARERLTLYTHEYREVTLLCVPHSVPTRYLPYLTFRTYLSTTLFQNELHHELALP